MSDPGMTRAPAATTDELAELALGVLTGRDRARDLAHVDSCPHCADELEQLARTADAVVRVAPEVEPPLGFEVRLFEQMGVDQVAADGASPARAVLGARDRGGRGASRLGRRAGARVLVGAVDVTAGECPAGPGRRRGRLGRAGRRQRNGRARR